MTEEVKKPVRRSRKKTPQVAEQSAPVAQPKAETKSRHTKLPNGLVIVSH